METNEKESLGLKPIIVNYLRNWKIIVIAGIFSLIIAILYLVLYPKTYETMARVQIQEDQGMLSSGSLGLGEAAGLMKSFGLGGMGSGSGISIDNEILNFYSNSLMSEMVVSLRLYTEYTPTFRFWYKMYGEEPVKVSCDSATIVGLSEGITFKVSVSDNGKVKIQSKTEDGKRKFQFDGFPAVVELKQGRFVFNRTENAQKSFSVKVQVNPPNWVAQSLADEINIEDYSKSADIIEFTYNDHKNERAKDILNTLIEQYNKNEVEYKQKLANASETFLLERINNVLKELDLVEAQIEKYKAANKITDVLIDIQYYAEYMKELNIKIIELETQGNMIDLMDEFVKNPDNNFKLVPSLFAAGQESEGSPLVLYNQMLLERERIIKSSSEENPLVQSLTLQADRLRESVYQMIENARLSIVQARKSLNNREQELLAKMGNVPEYERAYVNYKRQQEIFQGIYLILLQKREEIALSVGQNIDKVKVVDAAFTKKKAIAPRKIFALIGVILLTFVLSVSYLFLKDTYKSLKEEFKRMS